MKRYLNFILLIICILNFKPNWFSFFKSKAEKELLAKKNIIKKTIIDKCISNFFNVALDKAIKVINPKFGFHKFGFHKITSMTDYFIIRNLLHKLLNLIITKIVDKKVGIIDIDEINIYKINNLIDKTEEFNFIDFMIENNTKINILKNLEKVFRTTEEDIKNAYKDLNIKVNALFKQGEFIGLIIKVKNPEYLIIVEKYKKSIYCKTIYEIFKKSYPENSGIKYMCIPYIFGIEKIDYSNDKNCFLDESINILTNNIIERIFNKNETVSNFKLDLNYPVIYYPVGYGLEENSSKKIKEIRKNIKEIVDIVGIYSIYNENNKEIENNEMKKKVKNKLLDTRFLDQNILIEKILENNRVKSLDLNLSKYFIPFFPDEINKKGDKLIIKKIIPVFKYGILCSYIFIIENAENLEQYIFADIYESEFEFINGVLKSIFNEEILKNKFKILSFRRSKLSPEIEKNKDSGCAINSRFIYEFIINTRF